MRTKLLPFTARRGIAVATALTVAVAIGAPAVLAADGTGPAAPRNLVLTPERVTEDGHVELAWVRPRGGAVSHYEVHRHYGRAASGPEADETTFWMTTTDLAAADQLAVEGVYRYAVVAVDADGNRSDATAWKSVRYDDPANGDRLAEDTAGPAAPTGLAAEPAITRDGTVTLTWEAPDADDLHRYLVYRYRGDERATFLGYVEAGLTYFDDQLSEDGTYWYTVVAQDQVGNLSRRAEPVQVVRDSTAPQVVIRTPAQDKVYRPEGSLNVRIRVTEEGAGYDEDAALYFLNGKLLDTPVIPLGELADGSHVLEVHVVDRAGNVGTATATFAVDSRLLSDAPVMRTKSGFTNNKTVSFAWDAPQAEGVTGYNIYRAEGDDDFALIGTTAASVTEYEDVVPGEGRWSYQVAARYGNRKGEPSGAVVFTVDQTGPTVHITSPADGETYPAEGELAVAYRVRDRLAGVDDGQVVVELDGAVITVSQLSLARLAEGEHTLTVRATDRAGNTARARVTFNVVAVPDPGQPDDQPGGDREALRQQILQVLEKWEGKIHQGQLQALKAKLMNGNWVSFVHQVQKFSGKFIHPEAAKELLALFDSDDLDDWTCPWGNAGPIGRNEGWKDGWKKGWGDARDDDDDDDWNDDWDDDWDDDDDDDDDDDWSRRKPGKGKNQKARRGNKWK